MSNDLMQAEYESLSGLNVKLDAETVRSTLTRGNGKITDQEVAMFLRTCQAKKLDPLENGEVYLIKYDDKVPAQLVIGCHAYIRRADHFPDYRGFKAGITVIRGDTLEPVQKEGACIYKALKEKLIGGWCRVFRERSNGYIEETFVEVDFDEYCTGKSNWNAKPATMIRKVAISQAFRAAFPNEYEGLYTVDEIQASGAIPANYKVIEDTGEVVEVVDSDPPITQEQKQALFAIIRQNFDKESGNAVYVQLLANEGLKTGDSIPTSSYKRLLAAAMKAANPPEAAEPTAEAAATPEMPGTNE
jgi:phage recombination protein Bet